jgi:hypothetical protein
MTPDRPARVLLVTDHVDVDPGLLAGIERRAKEGSVRFRVIVPNPARAELHLFHPERHDQALDAELVLLEILPLLEQVAGGRVLGTVSVRHDPMDAVEEILFSEPVDEIMVSVAGHGLTKRLHLGLAERLRHFGLPVVEIGRGPTGRP